MGCIQAKKNVGPGARDEEEEEEVPIDNKFANAGNSIFYNKKALEKRGIDLEKDLDGSNDN